MRSKGFWVAKGVKEQGVLWSKVWLCQVFFAAKCVKLLRSKVCVLSKVFFEAKCVSAVLVSHTFFCHHHICWLFRISKSWFLEVRNQNWTALHHNIRYFEKDETNVLWQNFVYKPIYSILAIGSCKVLSTLWEKALKGRLSGVNKMSTKACQKKNWAQLKLLPGIFQSNIISNAGTVPPP